MAPKHPINRRHHGQRKIRLPHRTIQKQRPRQLQQQTHIHHTEDRSVKADSGERTETSRYRTARTNLSFHTAKVSYGYAPRKKQPQPILNIKIVCGNVAYINFIPHSTENKSNP